MFQFSFFIVVFIFYVFKNFHLLKSFNLSFLLIETCMVAGFIGPFFNVFWLYVSRCIVRGLGDLLGFLIP